MGLGLGSGLGLGLGLGSPPPATDVEGAGAAVFGGSIAGGASALRHATGPSDDATCGDTGRTPGELSPKALLR